MTDTVSSNNLTSLYGSPDTNVTVATPSTPTDERSIDSKNFTTLYSNSTGFTSGTVNSSVYSVNGGTGVTVNPTTGNVIVSIGQSVATTASPTFNSLTLTGDLAVNGGDITTTATTANLWVSPSPTSINIGGDSLNTNILINANAFTQNGVSSQVATRYPNIATTSPYLIMTTTRKSMRGYIFVEDNVTNEIHSVEYSAMKKASTGEAWITIYSEMFSNTSLVTFTVAVVGGFLSLYANLASANSTDITILRNSLGD